MATHDSDATFCSEIENVKSVPSTSQRYNTRYSQPLTKSERKNVSNFQSMIGSESKNASSSQPLTGTKRKNTRNSHPLTGPKRYQTRSSQVLNTDDNKNENEDESSKKPINKKLIGKREKPVIIKKIGVVTGTPKIKQVSAKAQVKNPFTKPKRGPAKKLSQSTLLEKIKKPSNIAKPSRGRFYNKSLQSKLVSPRVPKTRFAKIKSIVSDADQTDSDLFVTLDNSIDKNTNKDNSVFTEKSMNLYDKKEVEPYEKSLSGSDEKLKMVQNRALQFLEKIKKDRKEKEKTAMTLFDAPISKPTKQNPSLKFDPFLAPYTESLFSENTQKVAIVGPSIPNIDPSKSQSTYSFFNDSYLPLAQEQTNPFAMEQESDVDKSLDLFNNFNNSKVEFDKCSTSLQSFDVNRSFFDSIPKNMPPSIGFQESFVLDTDVEISETDESFMKMIFQSPCVELGTPQQWDIECQNNEKDELHKEISDGRLFSPIHLKLLARRLNLAEGFLKLCINQTFDAAMKLVSQPSMKNMETDSESHVSNSPEKESRFKRTSGQKISNDLFNIPIDESI